MTAVQGSVGSARRDPTRLSGTDRFKPVAMPSLDYTDEVARETAPLYERVKTVIRPSSGRSWRLTSRRSTT